MNSRTPTKHPLVKRSLSWLHARIISSQFLLCFAFFFLETTSLIHHRLSRGSIFYTYQISSKETRKCIVSQYGLIAHRRRGRSPRPLSSSLNGKNSKYRNKEIARFGRSRKDDCSAIKKGRSLYCFVTSSSSYLILHFLGHRYFFFSSSFILNPWKLLLYT